MGRLKLQNFELQQIRVGIYVSAHSKEGILTPTQVLIRAKEYKSLVAPLIQAASLGVLIEDLIPISIGWVF